MGMAGVGGRMVGVEGERSGTDWKDVKGVCGGVIGCAVVVGGKYDSRVLCEGEKGPELSSTPLSAWISEPTEGERTGARTVTSKGSPRRSVWHPSQSVFLSA